ncbi:MAG: cyclase family protein [Pirellulales bacterium]
MNRQNHPACLTHSWLCSVMLLCVCFASASLTSSISAAEPATMTSKDIQTMVKELSNWGRWGKEDQLGTMNLITPEKRAAAANLVTEGITVSLSRDADTVISLENTRPYKHTMINTGATSEQWGTDSIEIAPHGLMHTHMDSLCHFFYMGKMYNGFSKDEVTETGAKRLSIDNLKQGIVSRGVLIDVPRLRGVDFLKPGEAIYPSDLDAWEKKTGIQVQSGDIVLIRTGRWARRAKHGPWSPKVDGMAGLHASCAPWFKQRDIAMLGSDAAADVIPSGIEGVTHPIHLMMLHVMGVHILDNADFGQLSKTAAKLNRWQFMITIAPLPIKGGTGSPVNPIAVF